MTDLLTKAFRAVSALPAEEQDAWAARILAELEDEQRWDEQFAAAPELLERMADEAHQDYLAGRTELLDTDTLHPR
jgi:hypothetical protein